MNNAIEVRKLSKEYKNFKLDNIDIDIESGTIVGLIGENGAGKTTIIKSILNIINTNYESIKIFDKDYKKYENSIKEDIGVVLDNTFFPEILCPKDINKIMKFTYKNWDENLFQNYMNEFNIIDTQQLKKLSKGMRKKVEIAAALSHNPKLLILDEPTSGLDPVARQEILDIFLKFIEDENHTILFSTHITTDLEQIADHIIFIDNGAKIIDKSKDEILDNYGVLKCDIDYFENIDKEDVIACKKNKYDYQILVNDRNKIEKKYKECIIEKITLDNLMLLIIKGEK